MTIAAARCAFCARNNPVPIRPRRIQRLGLVMTLAALTGLAATP